MRSLKTAALFVFLAFLLLTASCFLTDRSIIKATVTSLVDGDGGEGTIILIDRGSAAGIELNQEGWVLEKGKTIATIMVDDLQSDACRAVVLEHTPFKPVTEGLTVLFGTNGTILSPDTLAPIKPCPDIPGPYVPTAGGNMARTGSYDEKGVPSPVGVLWIFKSRGEILTSSPPIAMNLAFLGDFAYFYVIDVRTGEKLRQILAPVVLSVYESPTVLNNTIYIPDGKRFYAVDVATGTEKWRFDMRAMAPAVTKDRVFLTSYGGTFMALDAATGKEIWRIETTEAESGEETRTIPALDGDIVYLGGADNYLYAVDARTGMVKWKYNVGWYLTSRFVVVGNDAIYVANRDYLIALDKQSRAEKWRFKVTGYVGIAPAVACGSVFVFDQGDLCSVDALTGLLKWRFSLKNIGFTKEEYTYDPPIVVDGIVYFGGLDESVYAVDADTGKLIWSYKTEFKTSTPVIVNGVLYVTSGPYLYAIK